MSAGDVTIPDPDPESAAEEVTGPGDEVMRFERDDLPASLLTPTGNVIGSAPPSLGRWRWSTTCSPCSSPTAPPATGLARAT
jgi:hypothetical protein